VTLTLGIATQLLLSAYHLIMVITCAKLLFVSNQRFKSYETDMKCTRFYTGPLSVTLTLGVATKLLHSAHHLIMVKDMERTQKCTADRRTD
jgi:hypothetical protein